MKNMQLIVIHREDGFSSARGYDLLEAVISCGSAAEILLEGLSKRCFFPGRSRTIIALPMEWHIEPLWHTKLIVYYNSHHPDYLRRVEEFKTNDWFILSNGRYATGLDWHRLSRLLSQIGADMISVKVDPALLSYREEVRLTTDGQVGGFRRFYCDSVLPCPVSAGWPHHIFFRCGVLNKIVRDGVLPVSFVDFLNRCSSKRLSWKSLSFGGVVIDLGTASGLLSLISTKARSINSRAVDGNKAYDRLDQASGCKISAEARFSSRVVAGRNVRVDKGAVVAGPTILCDDASIGRGAVIRSSIIGPGVSISEDDFLEGHIAIEPTSCEHKTSSFSITNSDAKQFKGAVLPFETNGRKHSNFRIWPRLSYARLLKRVADIIASLVILILFAPIFPVIVLAIKLNSAGPVFFRHKRQMRYGKGFYCLKFRTMIRGADRIQEKLRFKNQVDGPQFKVEKDPRVTVVGRFLRDTYIDEIPQFINILLGQMSVVGPRPSPESENSICPSWRDARLSVRPGITGLWQVSRTRRPGRDFQEWIYYDTQYVRNLSCGLDLRIFWRTAKKLIINFIEQF